MKKISLLIFTIGFVLPAFAQDIAISEWKVHLPFKKAIAVEINKSKVYCATPYCLFYYDQEDNSVNILSKVNGLSDIGISTIRHNAQHNVLVVAYANANIDLVFPDMVVNISDIKRKPIYGNKNINNISFYGNYAYLSCGFGIVVIDLARNEIRDTYYIGPDGNGINVYDLTSDGIKFFAATENGIYSAPVSNVNLANYASWVKDTSISHPDAAYNAIASFHGKIYTNLSVPGYSLDTMFVYDGNSWAIFDSARVDDVKAIRVSEDFLLICYNLNVVIYKNTMELDEIIWNYNPGSPEPNCAVKDEDKHTWIADNVSGLISYYDWQTQRVNPNGPAATDVFSMSIAGSDLYVAPGGVNTAWNNVWNNKGVFSYIQNTWYSLKDYSPRLDTIFDILSVAIDPSDNTHVYAGSFSKGLAEFRNGYLVNIWDQGNSGLEQPYSFYDWVGIGGLAFDENNNLWVVNAGCNNLLKVLEPNGNWESFSMVPYLNQARAGRVMVNSLGQKWVLLTNTSGLLVFDENGTLANKSDDKVKVLTTGVGKGNLPSGLVLSFAEDLDGKIWIGTDKGVAVFYSPENIFSGSNYDAQVITILQDGVAQHLLEFESVTAIAVDGANKKWFGTEKAGVFLMSADGQEQILHFTEDNSPLLSNSITSIVIDDNTGEVYFGTSNGIITYRHYATKGGETFQSVYAYPNPVPSGYTGTIGIKGLVRDAVVKITDVNGTLVYETVSEGGQAIWSGKDFFGNKVQSGVYFIMCSGPDGKQKLVSKIMVLN